MTLRKQIFLGILAFLLMLVGLFSVSGFSYHYLSIFIQKDLYPDLEIAKRYERFLANWMRLSEMFFHNLKSGLSSENLIPEDVLAESEGILVALDARVMRPPSRKALYEIQSLMTAFVREMRSCQRLLARRAQIREADSSRLSAVSAKLFQRATELSADFAKLNQDLSELLRNEDFRRIPEQSTVFLQRISRIERDLALVNEGIGRLPVRGPGAMDKRILLHDRQKDFSQVQKRLQAIIGLVETSLGDARNAVQKRVLNKIMQEVRSFLVTFRDLQEAFERPDSEILEIEEELEKRFRDLENFRKTGLHLASQEAEFYWNNISYSSQSLLGKNRTNLLISVAFLLLVAVAGIYALFTFPQRIAGPLVNLSAQVAGFSLGQPTPPSSGQKATREIQSLEDSFRGLATRLNEQVGVNIKYINAIEKLSQVYVQLGEAAALDPTTRDEGMEGVINQILDELMAGIPEIDLVKVMLLKSERTGEEKIHFFQRTGPVKLSKVFRQSSEVQPYRAAVLGNSEEDLESAPEKNIPFREGLTGYFFSDADLAFVSGDVVDSWKREHSTIPINDIPFLRSRAWECGLNGSVHGIILRRELTRSCLDIENKADDDKLGILLMYFQNPQARLSHQNLLFAQILARQICTVIESAELLKVREKQRRTEYQLEMAAQIQESLLPRHVPSIPGLHISSINKPAYEVGGDYYDFFELGDRRFGLVIADASGKNIPAAIIMTVFKTTLATIDLKHLSAGEVFAAANRVLLNNMSLEDRFITAMYVIIELATGKVEMACAGHNPALVVSGHGFELHISEWVGKGPPLGIMELEYSTSVFQLKPGDFFLMYTDGVTEARNSDGEEFGIGRLKKFLGHPRGPNPARDLYQEVAAFSGDMQQHDDITAVSLEFLGGKS